MKTSIAAIHGNTRVITAGEPRAVASSTLALLISAGKHFPSFGSEWSLCKCHSSCGSGELPGNSREISPEPSSIEKGVKAGIHW